MITLIFIAIWLGLSFKTNWIIFLIVSLVYLLIVFKRLKYKKFLICLGLICSSIGVSYIELDRSKTSYTGIVYEVKDNYFLFNSCFERLYCYQKNHNYEIGDVLNIKGNKSLLNFEVIESGFDFNSYLNNRGVKYSINAKNINFKFKSVIRINSYKKKILSKFDSNNSNIVNSFLFNKNESEIINELRYLQLNRLLSISGLYFTSIKKFLTYILEKFLKKKTASILTLCFLGIYVLLTFPRFTNIRLFTNELINYFRNKKEEKVLSMFDIKSITGIIFLLLNKYLAYQDGFKIGYFIPLIIHFCKGIFSHYKRLKKKGMQTLIFTILFFPLNLLYQNSFNPIAFFIQTILYPIYFLYILVSLLCFTFFPLFKISDLLSKIIIRTANLKWLGKLSIYITSFNSWSMLLYYTIVLVVLFLIEIDLKPLKRFSIIFFSSCILLYMVPIKTWYLNYVAFINVGQGDSCLIHYKNENILIDTGGKINSDIAYDSLIPFFKKKQIYKIDYLITTHDDNDHSGGVETLLSSFRVKNYVKDSSCFPLITEKIEINNYNLWSNEFTDENKQSLVLGFKIENKSFLIMGDADKEIENKIMNYYSKIECDVLKIGHHGSDTSTSDAFIKYLSPSDAVVSVGKNSYGHPSKKVLNILKNNHVSIKRTDELGTIYYTTTFLCS